MMNEMHQRMVNLYVALVKATLHSFFFFTSLGCSSFTVQNDLSAEFGVRRLFPAFLCVDTLQFKSLSLDTWDDSVTSQILWKRIMVQCESHACMMCAEDVILRISNGKIERFCGKKTSKLLKVNSISYNRSLILYFSMLYTKWACVFCWVFLYSNTFALFKEHIHHAIQQILLHIQI